jgi:hypothetical protein
VNVHGSTASDAPSGNSLEYDDEVQAIIQDLDFLEKPLSLPGPKIAAEIPPILIPMMPAKQQISSGKSWRDKRLRNIRVPIIPIKNPPELGNAAEI